jgi:SAM-dependent methyltransferase
MAECPLLEPSAWVTRWSKLIPAASRVLDLACGGGRHTRLLSQLGHTVVAVDRDVAAVTALGQTLENHRIDVRCHDLEARPWPFSVAEFDAVVVTNYLYRPLFAPMLASLRPEGVLLYETFARGNERFGKPSNPNFLLLPGELIERVRGALRVIAYEDRYVERPKPALVQRLCAIKGESAPICPQIDTELS